MKTNRFFIAITMLMIAAFFSFTSCDKRQKEIEVQDFRVEPTSVELLAGDTKQLEITLEPKALSIEMIEWTSSDPEIVTIEKSGILTGVKQGSATISAKIKDKEQVVNVTVKGNDVSNTNLRLMVGADIVLNLVKEIPAEKMKDVEAVISDEDKKIVLRISLDNLKFTGVAPGVAKVTLRSEDFEIPVELEVYYPEKMLYPAMDWGSSFDDIVKKETDAGSSAQGELKYDEDLWLNYQYFEKKTNQDQPISLLRYYFDDENKLKRAAIYYPFTLCFNDRGGGMGNFSDEFINMLEKEGFARPESDGASGFITIRKEPKTYLSIQAVTIEGQYYWGLTFYNSLF